MQAKFYYMGASPTSDRIREALRESSCSIRDLCEKTGLAESTVSEYVAFLREGKEAYIAEWRMSVKGHLTRYYRLGKKQDAVRPEPQDKVVINTRYLTKRKQKVRKDVDEPRIKADFQIPEQPELMTLFFPHLSPQRSPS